MKSILILFILVLPHLCQFSNTKHERIIGGDRAKQDQFPFFAQLYMLFNENDMGPATCGATLIHKRWILSAAHCLKGVLTAWVNMGTVKSSPINGHINKIITIHVHPGYVLKVTKDDEVLECINDVSLGKLEKDYKLSKSIQTIYLPSKNPRCKTGTVIGIGQTDFNPEIMEDYVKFATMPSIERKELGNTNLIPPSETLFFSEVPMSHKRYVYRGDSGGPYVCNFKGVYVQYGVTSQTDNDTVRKTVQSAFESVHHHMRFILGYVPKARIYMDKNPIGRASFVAQNIKSNTIIVKGTLIILVVVLMEMLSI